MKLGLVGKPLSGKKTVFEALTKSESAGRHKNENRIAAIRVPDDRVDTLTRMYKPKKTVYAQIEYSLGKQQEGARGKTSPWGTLSDCDALVHVVRNFPIPGEEPPAPYRDILSLDEEMMLSDLVIAETRLERMEADKKRGKKPDPTEAELLARVKEMLENGIPIRNDMELAASPVLRGFSFASAKPVLVLVNNGDEDTDLPDGSPPEGMEMMVIRGRLEHEISRMPEEDAKEFLKEFGIEEPVTHRAIRKSYQLLGLISFFTVGEDEVRAWTIKKGTPAVEAAGVIHSDMQKGFIRAEVVSYDDLIDAGSYAEARKRGTVRLEGKTYPMKDGDIVSFRFNV